MRGYWLLLFFLIPLAFNTASIIIGFVEANDPCQRSDSTGLILATWLKVCGFVGYGTNIILGACLIATIQADNEFALVAYVISSLINICFTVAWFVVGIVLVARSDGACVVDSTSLGVMAMIEIVLQGLSICATQSKTTVPSNTTATP